MRTTARAVLSTAEGLIYAVRDSRVSGDKKDDGVAEQASPCLRRWASLPETLARMKRDGNPLGSVVLRSRLGRSHPTRPYTQHADDRY